MITYIGQGKVKKTNLGTSHNQYSASYPSLAQARGPRSGERSSLAQASLPRPGESSTVGTARIRASSRSCDSVSP